MFVAICMPFSLLEANAQECRLRLEKTAISNKNSRNLTIGKRSSFKETVSSNSNKQTSLVTVMSGKTVSLTVDDTEAEILCTKYARSAQLEIKIKSATSGISTVRELSPGQMVDLGKVVKDLSSKESTIDLPNSFSKSKSSGRSGHDYYLYLLD